MSPTIDRVDIPRSSSIPGINIQRIFVKVIIRKGKDFIIDKYTYNLIGKIFVFWLNLSTDDVVDH